MTNKGVMGIVGGIAVGTVVAGVASLAAWSIIPITVWSVSITVIGSQTMNVLRVKSGQLQPVIVKKERTGATVVPMRQEA